MSKPLDQAAVLAHRARRRLVRAAADSAPVVRSARAHPKAQKLRRDIEKGRMALRVRGPKGRHPDQVLDEIVARAVNAAND